MTWRHFLQPRLVLTPALLTSRSTQAVEKWDSQPSNSLVQGVNVLLLLVIMVLILHQKLMPRFYVNQCWILCWYSITMSQVMEIGKLLI